MENNKFNYGIVIILFIGVMLVGCDTGKSSGNSSEVNLTGTYGRRVVSSGTTNDRLIFSETTFSSTDRSGPFLSGNYKFDGATLTLTIGGIKHIKYAIFRESILTISGEGAYSEFFNDTWTERK